MTSQSKKNKWLTKQSWLYQHFFSRTVLVVFFVVFIALVNHYFAISYNRSLTRKASQISHTVSSYYEDLAQKAKILTSTVAVSNAALSLNNAKCNEILADIANENSDFANIIIIDSAGKAACSIEQMPTLAIDVTNRMYFNKAIEEKEFVSGGYIEGRITGKKQLVFAFPVFNAKGDLNLMAVAGYKLDVFNGFFESLDLSEGYKIDLVDSRGIVFAQFPDRDGTGAQTLYQDVFQQALNRGSGTMESKQGDKTKLVAFRALDGMGDGYIIASVDKKPRTTILLEFFVKYAVPVTVTYLIIVFAVYAARRYHGKR